MITKIKILTLIYLPLIGILLSCNKTENSDIQSKEANPPSLTTPKPDSKDTDPPIKSAPAVKPGLKNTSKILGRWQRSDGGYMIQINHISANGEASANYYNPNPVNVSVAKAFEENDELFFFLELQDVGYDGSHYKLKYVPSEDMLAGTYFLAQTATTYEHFFIRMKN